MRILLRGLILLLLCAPVLPDPAAARASEGEQEMKTGPADPAKVGIVCHVKVVSDKVPDMTNLETWKKAYIKEGMTDEQKALAVWKTVRTYQHQEAPPVEFLHNEDAVQDPFKIFNVYGYSLCSIASCDILCLARSVGLQARGRIINAHSVPEVYWDGAWHLLDSSLMCYFPKADGKIASVDEIMAGIKEWYDKNPGYKGNDKKLVEFMRGGGWKKGPEILSRCPNYDQNGWLEAATHGWYSTMAEYDGSHNGIYEYGYSQGYEVNIRLRPGERLTRNWSNKGLHVNMTGGGGVPACMTMKTGQDSLRYTPKDGDLAPGRVGNGTHEYTVPASVLQEAAKAGSLTVRMPSSYVYLSGKAAFKAAGPVTVQFSDNNGLDWRDVAATDGQIDLTPLVFRRYDYRLAFKGALQSLKIEHDIQHSQRPLPALDAGKNTLTFSAGAPESTITVEGATNEASKGKQLLSTDFKPEKNGMDGWWFQGKGDLTYTVSTPGDITRVRFGSHYRIRDARDYIDYQLSYDGGRTWTTVEKVVGPTPGHSHYVTSGPAPAGSREVKVRYAGTSRNTTGFLNLRIDADYREPAGGFRPVKVTYRWDEDGKAKEQVFVAKKPLETWTITCAAKPVMKSIVMELAE